MKAQEEAMQPFSKESEAEIKALKEDMQLVLKKEAEAQVSVKLLSWCTKISCFLIFKSHLWVLFLQKEISALRLSLAHQQSEGDATKDNTDHKVWLLLHFESLRQCLDISIP